MVAQFHSQKPSTKRKGRPTTYSEEVILFAVILKQHLNISYRILEHLLKDILGYSPDFSTLFYRFKKLDIRLVSFVISKTAEICQADATGFGYEDKVELNYLRGRQLREVKSHVKAEVLIGVRGSKKIVLGVSVDRAYSDELGLLWEILGSAQLKAQHFVADGYYDSVKLIRYMEERSIRCVIPISETLRKGVKNEYRRRVKSRYEDGRYYRRVYKQNGYKVERLFGSVKRIWGDRDNTRVYEFARLFVMVRFVLWNLMMILKLYFWLFHAYPLFKHSPETLLAKYTICVILVYRVNPTTEDAPPYLLSLRGA